MEAPGRIAWRRGHASGFKARDQQGVIRSHPGLDPVDAPECRAGLLRIDTRREVNQRRTAIGDAGVPHAVSAAGHRVDRRQRGPRLHVVIRNDHDDGVSPAAGEFIEHDADDLIGCPVAGAGRLAFGAVVMSDRVGFVDVAEDEPKARIGDGVEEMGEDGGINRIAMRVE